MIKYIFNQMVKYSYTDVVLSALADPTRREVVQKLSEESLNVSDLYRKICKVKLFVDELDSSVLQPKAKMSLPGLSKHLKILENARLIKREKMGREYKFSLTRYADFWVKELKNLERFLATSDKDK
jgi:DNA-binding transcriptional ArsR family regulator